jgi:hypothetical protein
MFSFLFFVLGMLAKLDAAYGRKCFSELSPVLRDKFRAAITHHEEAV